MKIKFLFQWTNRKAPQTGFNHETHFILKEFPRTVRLTSGIVPDVLKSPVEDEFLQGKVSGKHFLNDAVDGCFKLFSHLAASI